MLYIYIYMYIYILFVYNYMCVCGCCVQYMYNNCAFICIGYRCCMSLAVEVELGLAFGADKGHKIGGVE